MFEFTIEADIFNALLRRLTSVAAGDGEAYANFSLDGNSLSVTYTSKIDSDVSSVFFEQYTVKGYNSGSASVLIKELTGIRVKEFSREDKFPHTKEIKLKFSSGILVSKWEVLYSSEQCTTFTLNHPLLNTEISEDLINKLNKQYTNSITLPAIELEKSIIQCNLFKSDATSREGSGCLLMSEKDSLVVVGTDSIMAVYKETTVETAAKESKSFRAVASNSVLNTVKNFITGAENVQVALYRSSIFLQTGNRKMVAPLMNATYDIENPKEFFKVSAPLIGRLPASSIASVIGTLTHLNTDFNRKITVESSKKVLNIFTDLNRSDNLPAEIETDAKFIVNSSLLSTSLQKLASFSQDCFLYYDSGLNRVSLCSVEGDLVFLIQGMNS
jgi:hypothetical protein